VAAHDLNARRAAARVAIYSRHRGADDPAVTAARRDLRVARAEERLRAVAGELTAEERARLGALVTGSAPAEPPGEAVTS